MSLRHTFLAAAALALLCTWSFAQQQPNPTQPQLPRFQQPGVRQAQPAQPGQTRTTLKPEARQGESMADHDIASWLVLCNEVEVRLAQFAEKHAHDAGVKQFAQKMIEDHGNLINQLRQFAPDAPQLAMHGESAVPAADNRAAGQARENRNATQENAARPAGERPAGQQFAQGGHLPIAQISYQLAERNLKSAMKELGSKQGSEFDKAYIGCQIHEHGGMLTTVEVLRGYASPQLASILDKAVPTTEQHFTHAKKIGEQLWGGGEQSLTGRQEDRENNNNNRDKNDK